LVKFIITLLLLCCLVNIHLIFFCLKNIFIYRNYCKKRPPQTSKNIAIIYFFCKNLSVIPKIIMIVNNLSFMSETHFYSKKLFYVKSLRQIFLRHFFTLNIFTWFFLKVFWRKQFYPKTFWRKNVLWKLFANLVWSNAARFYFRFNFIFQKIFFFLFP